MWIWSEIPTPRTSAAPRVEAATDTTVLSQFDGLEVGLSLSPVPRAVGEMVALEVVAKNVSDSARELIVSPCHLFSRGVQAVPELECQTGPRPMTLHPGQEWSMRSQPKFQGPAGSHRLEVQAVQDPSVWIGLDITLSPGSE
jgi:hypothetical protein